jgi:hypothetical protein
VRADPVAREGEEDEAGSDDSHGFASLIDARGAYGYTPVTCVRYNSSPACLADASDDPNYSREARVHTLISARPNNQQQLKR